MEVLSQIESDLIAAIKAKDELMTLTLRQLKTSITNAEISNSRKKLSDEQVVKLLRSEVKKRREAAELYTQGGRQELAAKENGEIEIVTKYLPAELSEEQIKKTVVKVIKTLGAAGPQDIGKAMGAVMKELGSAADGTTVSRLVKEALG